MSFFQVQQRTSQGLSDVGQFPEQIVGESGSAIIESGENANGSYIKFADGTLICNSLCDVIKNDSNGVSRYSYPIAFKNIPKNCVTSSFGLVSSNIGGTRTVEIGELLLSSYTLKLIQIENGGGITLPDTGSMFSYITGNW